MDPKISKKTQDTLGKIIKKPPLTDKLLSKPPFRFLHDIMTSVIKTTGVMKGLYADSELNSENVKDKESKIAFLQKAIDFVAAASGKQLSVKPAKIVAGHEPEKTNEFLQALASAINAKVDNDDVIDKVNNKGGSSKKEEKKEERSKDRDKSGDRRKREDDKRSRERSQDKEKSRDKEDRHKEKEDRHKEKEDRHRDKEDRHKDKDRDRDRERERESRHKSGRSRPQAASSSRSTKRPVEKQSREKREDEGKENDAPKKDMVNGDHKPADAAPAKMQRPSSAKGSRRRMEGGLDSSDEDVPVQKQESHLGEDDLPPQVQASRLARPSSARPAPPKRKDDVVHNEPAMRLGSGKPQNLIIDDGKDSDEDETFVVEESAPPPVEPETRPAEENEDEDEDHGGLVKKIMETKKEYEQQRKPEIERPTISDAQRRKQREAVQREIDKLRSSIQTLTRSANPLGKIMDYVQEDLDSMQKELEKWKAENKEHGLALKREKAITDRAVEPLKIQLSEVDQAIRDQLDLIGAVKSNIIRNDQKIEKMLRTIAKS